MSDGGNEQGPRSARALGIVLQNIEVRRFSATKWQLSTADYASGPQPPLDIGESRALLSPEVLDDGLVVLARGSPVQPTLRGDGHEAFADAEVTDHQGSAQAVVRDRTCEAHGQ